MVAIKLYQPEDLIKSYALSWHIDSAATVSALSEKISKEVKSFDELLNWLDNYLLSQLKSIKKDKSLSDEQFLALVKVVYLQHELYQDFSIFDIASATEDKLIKLQEAMSEYKFLPEKKVVMPEQKIKVYNPFSLFLQYLKKGFHHAFGRK